MIDDSEIRAHAARLSVPESQVRRDHLLSHLINAIPCTDEMVFIGGTALNRTYLPDVRLSEDLDIFLVEGDPEVLANLLRESVRLEFPDLEVERLGSENGVTSYNLRSGGLTVRLQVITDRPAWAKLPRGHASVRLRYSDLAVEATIVVPKVDALVAMKLSAFIDRRFARDLFDLGALAAGGLLTDASVALTQELIGRSLVKQEFEQAPSNETWVADLGNQIGDPGDPESTRKKVYDALGEILGWE